MSHYDAAQNAIVRWPPQRDEQHPGWIREDCGCCGGLMWGGEEPRECRDCGGAGVIWRHEQSGTLAAWPGGPLLGRVSLKSAAGLPRTTRGC